MWIRNGGLIAAVLALLAAGVVAFGAWYTLTHGTVCETLLHACNTTTSGAITLVIMLLAGGLMAYAFGQTEETIVLFRERSSKDSGGDDERA